MRGLYFQHMSFFSFLFFFSVLKCEYCGSLAPASQFRGSKRFCSNTCAKRSVHVDGLLLPSYLLEKKTTTFYCLPLNLLYSWSYFITMHFRAFGSDFKMELVKQIRPPGHTPGSPRYCSDTVTHYLKAVKDYTRRHP